MVPFAVIEIDWGGKKDVTDTSLKQLEGLTRLKVLDLSGTQITDTGLEQLEGFTKSNGWTRYDTGHGCRGCSP